MNIERLFDEAIELIQNRRKRSIESTSSSEYNYGRTTAFNEALATIKDLKKTVVVNEKMTISNNIAKNNMAPIKKEIKIARDNTLQIV